MKEPRKYRGTNGEQIGIYGGTYPWNTVPENPQIISKKIAEKTTPEGLLKVEIKVEVQP